MLLNPNKLTELYFLPQILFNHEQPLWYQEWPYWTNTGVVAWIFLCVSVILFVIALGNGTGQGKENLRAYQVPNCEMVENLNMCETMQIWAEFVMEVWIRWDLTTPTFWGHEFWKMTNNNNTCSYCFEETFEMTPMGWCWLKHCQVKVAWCLLLEHFRFIPFRKAHFILERKNLPLVTTWDQNQVLRHMFDRKCKKDNFLCQNDLCTNLHLVL